MNYLDELGIEGVCEKWLLCCVELVVCCLSVIQFSSDNTNTNISELRKPLPTIKH